LQKTPQQPDKPPAEKTVDTDKLLASLTTIAFHFNSPDTDANAWLNPIIATQAIKAAKQIRLTPDEKAPNVMSIDVNASNENELFTVAISAELTCPNPNGGPVTVWKQSKQLVSFDPRRVRADPAMKMVKSAAGKFFEQFADEVRRARSKAKPK